MDNNNPESSDASRVDQKDLLFTISRQSSDPQQGQICATLNPARPPTRPTLVRQDQT
ncbi:hypothetical protein MMC14_010790, partial [Varicellaria rhodocarpa]|nr:hypothetical protein [Varicellaria rhodocarpa]